MYLFSSIDGCCIFNHFVCVKNTTKINDISDLGGIFIMF